MKPITKEQKEMLRNLIGEAREREVIQFINENVLVGIHPEKVGMAGTFEIILNFYKREDSLAEQGKQKSHDEYEREHRKKYGPDGLKGATMQLIKFVGTIPEKK